MTTPSPAIFAVRLALFGLVLPQAMCVQQPAPRAPETLDALGREMQLSFPPSTKLIGVHRMSGLDDLVAVKLKMTYADWLVFLRSTPIRSEQFEAGARGLFGPDDGFWDPHRAQGLQAAQTELAGSRALNLGVSEMHNGIVAVYVVNHGT